MNIASFRSSLAWIVLLVALTNGVDTFGMNPNPVNPELEKTVQQFITGVVLPISEKLAQALTYYDMASGYWQDRNRYIDMALGSGSTGANLVKMAIGKLAGLKKVPALIKDSLIAQREFVKENIYSEVNMARDVMRDNTLLFSTANWPFGIGVYRSDLVRAPLLAANIASEHWLFGIMIAQRTQHIMDHISNNIDEFEALLRKTVFELDKAKAEAASSGATDIWTFRKILITAPLHAYIQEHHRYLYRNSWVLPSNPFKVGLLPICGRLAVESASKMIERRFTAQPGWTNVAAHYARPFAYRWHEGESLPSVHLPVFSVTSVAMLLCAPHKYFGNLLIGQRSSLLALLSKWCLKGAIGGAYMAFDYGKARLLGREMTPTIGFGISDTVLDLLFSSAFGDLFWQAADIGWGLAIFDGISQLLWQQHIEQNLPEFLLIVEACRKSKGHQGEALSHQRLETFIARAHKFSSLKLSNLMEIARAHGGSDAANLIRKPVIISALAITLAAVSGFVWASW